MRQIDDNLQHPEPFDPLKYNIQTAEAPIEVVMPHTNQVEIGDFGRNTFLNWVRGIVREAPDILMMGEIRDLETADALLRVVNTGHRVIATLRANSAAMVPIRLQLGVQPFLIAAGYEWRSRSVWSKSSVLIATRRCQFPAVIN